MKAFLFGLTMLSAMSWVVTTWAGDNPAAAPLRLDIDLVDGSHIIGVPAIKGVSLKTSYAQIDIPLEHIVVIKMSNDHENATLELQKGDRLSGIIDLAPLKLGTSFGDVTLGGEHIRVMRVGRHDGHPTAIPLGSASSGAGSNLEARRGVPNVGAPPIKVSVAPPNTVMLDPNNAGGCGLRVSDRLTPGKTYRVTVDISGDSGGPTRSVFLWQGGFQDGTGQSHDAEYLSVKAGETYSYSYPDNGTGAGPYLFAFFADAHNPSDNTAKGELTFDEY